MQETLFKKRNGIDDVWRKEEKSEVIVNKENKLNSERRGSKDEVVGSENHTSWKKVKRIIT